MTKQEKQNYEADYFARCLLMPREFIEFEINNINNLGEKMHPEEVVQRLAKVFNVTVMQMTIRLSELKILK